MFNFRLINTPGGNQIIDSTLSTPYEALTPVQMVEYTEMERQIAIMERMERKARRKEEKQRKLSKNILYKFACIIGVI